jgi:hypothetical protein
MTLGGKSSQVKASDFVNALKSEGELKDDHIAAVTVASRQAPQATPGTAPTVVKGVHIEIEEKVNVKLDREGGLQSVELLGNLSLSVDAKNAFISLQCTPLDPNMFQLKVNPKVSKESFNSSAILELADKSKGFVEGRSLALLKWRMPPSTDESRVPLMVNCWPSKNVGGYSVSLDFEHLLKSVPLQNVVVSVPLSAFGSSPPQIIQVDGDATYNNETQTLNWHIAKIGPSNATGTLEFEICGEPPVDSFFPINISFSSLVSYSGFKLLRVFDINDESTVDHSHVMTMASDQYVIV